MSRLLQEDIPKLTNRGNYSSNIHIRFLERTINEYLEQGFDINPDFQRGHVWNMDHKVKWIEYILSGGDRFVNPIYLNQANWPSGPENPFVIVDGKQRLSATLEFVRDEFTVFHGLKGKPEGWKYSEFDKAAIRGITIPISINSLKTRKEVLKWYLELNSGIVPHSTEELERVSKLLEKENEV